MKILEFIPHLMSGGGEKFVVDISSTFIKQGHQCELLTMFAPTDNDLLFKQIDPAVPTHNLAKHLGADIGCLFRFYNFVRHNRPDVVHIHLEAIKYSLLSVFFYRKCKYYITIHTDAKRDAGSGLIKYFRKFLFKTGLIMPVTISQESEASFQECYGFKAQMIPNGTAPYIIKDISSLYYKYHSDVDFLFVHAGRLHRVKNQKLLIDAFEEVRKKGYSARLLLLGRGDSGEIVDYVNSHVSDYLIYVGETSNVRDYVSIADAFCLSSLNEGLPITILEAYSVGCPVIATPVGGCKNVVKKSETGYLSKDLTLESYVEALETFMNSSHSNRMKMKDNCKKEFLEGYSIEKCAARYAKLFENNFI